MSSAELAAGAELDAEIERRLFGREIICSCGIDCDDIPPYSTDVAAAWLVVGQIIEGDDTGFYLEYQPTQYWPKEQEPMEPARHWRAMCGLSGTDMGWRESYADTMPLAVCRLALKLPWGTD